jgi:hypothetical protein
MLLTNAVIVKTNAVHWQIPTSRDFRWENGGAREKWSVAKLLLRFLHLTDWVISEISAQLNPSALTKSYSKYDLNSFKRRPNSTYNGSNLTAGGHTNTRCENSVTQRTPREIDAVKRAFAVGAIVHGNATFSSAAKLLGFDQGGLPKLMQCTKAKVEASRLPVFDSILYKNEPGRGRPKILTQAPKDDTIRITT